MAEYLLFRLLALLVRLLPYGWADAFGTGLGIAVLNVTGYRKAVTLDNLERAFPEKGADEIWSIMRGAYANYGRAVVHMLWAGGQDPDELRKRVRLVHADILDTAAAEGRGVILMSAHFGSWEFLLTAMKLHIATPFLAIVQRQRNERVDRIIDAGRQRFDVTTVSMGPSVREVLSGLREGKIVIILGDQSGPRESIFIPFFGRPSATHRGAAAFCLRSGAPLLMVLLVRRPDGNYDAVFERVAADGLEGDREAQIVALTQRHAAVLERYVRAHPEHWLWMHRRWKHTAEHEAREHEAAGRGGRS